MKSGVWFSGCAALHYGSCSLQHLVSSNSEYSFSLRLKIGVSVRLPLTLAQLVSLMTSDPDVTSVKAFILIKRTIILKVYD